MVLEAFALGVYHLYYVDDTAQTRVARRTNMKSARNAKAQEDGKRDNIVLPEPIENWVVPKCAISANDDDVPGEQQTMVAQSCSSVKERDAKGGCPPCPLATEIAEVERLAQHVSTLELISILLRDCDDEAGNIREHWWWAAWALLLQAEQNPDTWQVLADYMQNDENEEVRRHCVLALWPFDDNPAAQETLLNTARNDPSWRVRLLAIDQLPNVGQFTAWKMRLAFEEYQAARWSDDFQAIRWKAVEILKSCDAPAIPFLKLVAQDHVLYWGTDGVEEPIVVQFTPHEHVEPTEEE